MSQRRTISPKLTLFLVLFVVSVGFGLVIPIFPLITREFGASPFMLGVMTAGYSVVQFLFAPAWGQVSDRFGRKPVLLIGLLGLALSFIFMGFAQSFAGLFWARVLGGFLGSATLPAAQAMAAELSGTNDRAKAMGLMGAAFGTGFIFGPVLGGLLAPFGMAVPFFAGGILGLGTVALAAVALREPERTAVGEGASDGQTTGGVAGHIAGLIKNIRVAVNGPGAPYFTLAFVIMFTQSTMMTALAYFFTDRFGIGPATIGLIFAMNGALGAGIQGGAIGPITTRFGDRSTILIGLGIGALGYAALVFAPSLLLAVISVGLLAISMSLTRPTATSALSKATTLPQGITMGVQSSFDSLGRIVGPLWAGFTYELSQGLPFVSAAVVCVAALLYIKARTNPLIDESSLEQKSESLS